MNTGIWISIGKQPPSGLTFSFLYSSIVAWPIAARSSPWRSFSAVSFGCRSFIFAIER